MDRTHLEHHFFAPLERAQAETGTRLVLYGSTASRIAMHEASGIKKPGNDPFTLFDYCRHFSDINIRHDGPAALNWAVLSALEHHMPYFDFFRWSVKSAEDLRIYQQQAPFSATVPARQIAYDAHFARLDQAATHTALTTEFIPPQNRDFSASPLGGKFSIRGGRRASAGAVRGAATQGRAEDLPATGVLLYANHLVDLARFGLIPPDGLTARLTSDQGIEEVLEQSFQIMGEDMTGATPAAQARLIDKCASLVAGAGWRLLEHIREHNHWAHLLEISGPPLHVRGTPYIKPPRHRPVALQEARTTLSRGNAEDKFFAMLVEEAAADAASATELAPGQDVLATIEDIHLQASTPAAPLRGQDIFTCTIDASGIDETLAEEDLSALVYIETSEGAAPLPVAAICHFALDRSLLTLSFSLADQLPEGENTLRVYLIGLSMEATETDDTTRNTIPTAAEAPLEVYAHETAPEAEEAYEIHGGQGATATVKAWA